MQGLSRLRARLALDETGRHVLSVWFEGTVAAINLGGGDSPRRPGSRRTSPASTRETLHPGDADGSRDGVSPTNSPLPSGDDWNEMEIGFMARRYNGAGRPVREATATVKINNTTVLYRAGISNSMTADRQGDVYLAGPQEGDPIYPGGGDWTRECGFILLQEHDNMVQFKDIRVNPDWLPMKDGQFDTNWQRVI